MASNHTETIGFIGAGVMGAPMVRRLLGAGFSVRVWNRTAAKVEPLVASGAIRATSPADAANGMDMVLSCLADAPALEAALFGSDGIALSTRAPSQFVDFSTIGPTATLEFAERLRGQCGTSWVDAPVSGGAVGAEQGRLVIFCGGSVDNVTRLKPVLSVLAQRYTRVGDIGSGQTLKLCNQLIVSSNLVAIAESLALARASGLDPTMLPDALAGGFADSLPLQIFGRRMAAGISEPVLGQIGHMLKDLRAVEDLARAKECQLPMMSAALRIYCDAADRGLLRNDLATLYMLY